jgi:hypothetical protein
MKEQTSVEWLEEKFNRLNGQLIDLDFERAKEMEKKQRRESYENGYINGEMDAYTE